VAIARPAPGELPIDAGKPRAVRATCVSERARSIAKGLAPEGRSPEHQAAEAATAKEPLWQKAGPRNLIEILRKQPSANVGILRLRSR
jgi:hypothetical protein